MRPINSNWGAQNFAAHVLTTIKWEAFQAHHSTLMLTNVNVLPTFLSEYDEWCIINWRSVGQNYAVCVEQLSSQKVSKHFKYLLSMNTNLSNVRFCQGWRNINQQGTINFSSAGQSSGVCLLATLLKKLWTNCGLRCNFMKGSGVVKRSSD